MLKGITIIRITYHVIRAPIRASTLATHRGRANARNHAKIMTTTAERSEVVVTRESFNSRDDSCSRCDAYFRWRSSWKKGDRIGMLSL